MAQPKKGSSSAKKKPTTRSASRKTTSRASSSSRQSAASLQEAQRSKRNMWSVILFAIGILFAILVLVSGTGIWNGIHGFLFGILGWSAYFIPILLIYIAVLAAMEKPVSISGKLIISGIFLLMLAATIEIFTGLPDAGGFVDTIVVAYQQGIARQGGGVLSLILAVPLNLLGSPAPQVIIILALFVFFMLVTGSSLVSLFRMIVTPVRKVEDGYANARKNRLDEFSRSGEKEPEFVFDLPPDSTTAKQAKEKDIFQFDTARVTDEPSGKPSSTDRNSFKSSKSPKNKKGNTPFQKDEPTGRPRFNIDVQIAERPLSSTPDGEDFDFSNGVGETVEPLKSPWDGGELYGSNTTIEYVEPVSSMPTVTQNSYSASVEEDLTSSTPSNFSFDTNRVTPITAQEVTFEEPEQDFVFQPDPVPEVVRIHPLQEDISTVQIPNNTDSIEDYLDNIITEDSSSKTVWEEEPYFESAAKDNQDDGYWDYADLYYEMVEEPVVTPEEVTFDSLLFESGEASLPIEEPIEPPCFSHSNEIPDFVPDVPDKIFQEIPVEPLSTSTVGQPPIQPESKLLQAVERDIPVVEAELVGYVYPPYNLLKNSSSKSTVTPQELKSNGDKLIETLKSFGVQARILDIAQGPAVTRYEIQPAAGVKISKITGLSDDIALNLAASGIRIEAPIPGKPAVGIEVPNKTIGMVGIREIVESRVFEKSSSKLSIALGKDISGNVAVGNIASMPHVLIAGATGSGKSVCINSIIVSLLYKSSPEEVKFLMVDPKVVELGIYNGIPHLLVPVVTDPKKAAGALSWAVSEMLKRYKLFADNTVRDLDGYNKLADSRDDLERLPQIVIIIDELADLMMAAPNEVEDSICRLAQMARAAGMHLVIATQRPSVDVITGVIKANIPSRIAFAVSSQVDSRTILDSGGAEKLLGRGDMLYYPSGAPKPTRVQGCFVSDQEVESVVRFVKESSAVQYDEEIAQEIERNTACEKSKDNDGGGFDEQDEMFPLAVECVVEAGQASTSLLQRRLKLGYARAARIVDQMEQAGIVGPFEGSKPRQVLITKEQYYEMKMRQAD